MADLQQYRYGYERPDQTQCWSRIYSDFGECYADYVTLMQEQKKFGMDLSAYNWRGVFNLEQAAEIIMGGVDLSADLTVTFGG